MSWILVALLKAPAFDTWFWEKKVKWANFKTIDNHLYPLCVSFQNFIGIFKNVISYLMTQNNHISDKMQPAFFHIMELSKHLTRSTILNFLEMQCHILAVNNCFDAWYATVGWQVQSCLDTYTYIYIYSIIHCGWWKHPSGPRLKIWNVKTWPEKKSQIPFFQFHLFLPTSALVKLDIIVSASLMCQ